MTATATNAAAPASTAGAARSVLSALRRALEIARAVVLWLFGLLWRALRPVLGVVSPLGWLVLLVAAGSLVVSLTLGWEEFFFLGTTLLAGMFVALAFVFGRATYSVEIELSPRRVKAGEEAYGSILVTNNNSVKRTTPTRMELPVGGGVPEFGVPPLEPAEQWDQLFPVITAHRAVINAGPAISVRGDQLGLLRRTVRWTDVIELFVHPVTVNLAPSAAGLVRDLEGQASKTITDNDLSFHALRPYVPGDNPRNIHWRTSARAGALKQSEMMVRQFEETRRSQATIIQSTWGAYYASDDEFELAVSVLASIAAQVIRDGTMASVVTDRLALRAHSEPAMLDDTCRLQQTRKRWASPREFARELTRRLPAPSVAIMIAGSAIEVSDFRAMGSLFPDDATVVAVKVVLGVPPRISRSGGITVVTLGELADLPGLIKRAAS